jgi:hypothetical protein
MRASVDRNGGGCKRNLLGGKELGELLIADVGLLIEENWPAAPVECGSSIPGFVGGRAPVIPAIRGYDPLGRVQSTAANLLNILRRNQQLGGLAAILRAR